MASNLTCVLFHLLHLQIENLESRCTMLQKQLAEMNERNLETRKENQLLQLRLKTIEEHQGSDRKSLMLPSQSSIRKWIVFFFRSVCVYRFFYSF